MVESFVTAVYLLKNQHVEIIMLCKMWCSHCSMWSISSGGDFILRNKNLDMKIWRHTVYSTDRWTDSCCFLSSCLMKTCPDLSLEPEQTLQDVFHVRPYFEKHEPYDSPEACLQTPRCDLLSRASQWCERERSFVKDVVAGVLWCYYVVVCCVSISLSRFLVLLFSYPWSKKVEFICLDEKKFSELFSYVLPLLLSSARAFCIFFLPVL